MEMKLIIIHLYKNKIKGGKFTRLIKFIVSVTFSYSIMSD